MDDSKKTKEQLLAELAELRLLQADREKADAERRRAEAALRLSEEKFSKTFHASASLMALSTLEEGRLLDVNDAYLDTLGFSREEAIGKTSLELQIFAEKADRDTLISEIVRNGRIRNYELTLRTKEGSLRQGLLSVEPIPIQGVTHLLTTMADITETKRAEDALRRSEEQLKLAIEGSGVGLWDWKVQTGEATFNDRWAEICGYTLCELEPVSINTWLRLVHPEDLAESNDLIQEHFSGSSTLYRCEARMRHKDGHWVWVLDRGKVTEWDEDGKPLRMTGTHLDITERKQADEEREKLIDELQKALASVKMLSGLLPICASCKRIRDDRGNWQPIESYIRARTEAEFSHGVCPECMKKLYPGYCNNP